MPDANVTIHMTTQQLALWQAIDKSNEKFLQMERGLSGVELASRKSARAEAELEKAAKRVWDETRTPMERHITKLGELNRLVEKGKLDQDTYARAVKQSQAALEAAGNAGQGAFGKIGGELAGMLTGTLSVAAALNLTRGILNDIDRERKEAAQKQVEAQFDIGKLAQVADIDPNSPEGMRGLAASSDKIFAAGGAQTRGAAARLVFGAKSAGQVPMAEFFGDLYRSRLVDDPAQMLTAANTIQASMGEKETGNLRGIVSKAFGASLYSPASAESILSAAAEGGIGGRVLGISDEELLAATAEISRALAKQTGKVPTAAEAGTRVKSLMKGLSRMGGGKMPMDDEDIVDELRAMAAGEDSPSKRKPRFDFVGKGKSLIQMLEEIEAQGLTEPETQKLFGRQEGRQAMGLLMLNRERYGKALAYVRHAEADDEVGKRLTMYKQLPEVSVTSGLAVAKAGLELARRPMGTWENAAEMMEADIATAQHRAGKWASTRWLAAQERAFFRKIEGPEVWVRNFAGTGRNTKRFVGELSPSTLGAIRDLSPEVADTLEKAAASSAAAAAKLNAAAEKLDAAVDRTRQTTLGSPTEDK